MFYIHGVGLDTAKFADCGISRDEIREKLGIPQDKFVLLSVSEINANKNHKTTLTAFSKINNENMLFLIAGTGVLLEECERLAAALGIADRVKFLGYRRDVNELVHAADVFLFPSLREGLGFAPLEAMSAGVPVIASDNRGVREFAVNMENSILLDANDIDGFAKAITLLYEDEKLRRRLGENARAASKPFDISSSLAEMSEIYRKYLK